MKDESKQKPPEHVGEDVAKIFREGATCLTVECFNASSAMFRLCIDLATQPLLPKPGAKGPRPNRSQRKTLGPRVEWLFKNKRLDESLYNLSECVRKDGNDAAHVGNIGKEDAEDLLDFTRGLLERLYTEPAKLKLAEKRREDRRNPPQDA